LPTLERTLKNLRNISEEVFKQLEKDFGVDDLQKFFSEEND